MLLCKQFVAQLRYVEPVLYTSFELYQESILSDTKFGVRHWEHRTTSVIHVIPAESQHFGVRNGVVLLTIISSRELPEGQLIP